MNNSQCKKTWDSSVSPVSYYKKQPVEKKEFLRKGNGSKKFAKSFIDENKENPEPIAVKESSESPVKHIRVLE